MTLGGILPWLYMIIFMIIGWRLYVIGWPLRLKIAAGVAMVVGPPLLFVLPAVRNGGDTARLLYATAFAMLLMGALCLLGGIGATWLRERARRGR